MYVINVSQSARLAGPRPGSHDLLILLFRITLLHGSLTRTSVNHHRLHCQKKNTVFSFDILKDLQS